MRELFRNKYVEEGELKELLSMVDDRNMTVYTYDENLAETLFTRLSAHANLMKSVVDRIEGKSTT